MNEAHRGSGKFDRVRAVQACCARERVHSGVAYPSVLAWHWSRHGASGPKAASPVRPGPTKSDQKKLKVTQNGNIARLPRTIRAELQMLFDVNLNKGYIPS
jgi:hypothetical protein